MKIFIFVLIASGLFQFAGAEDFSKRLARSFDTTPAGKRSEKLKGGANPVLMQAGQAFQERRLNDQMGMANGNGNFYQTHQLSRQPTVLPQ